MEKPKTNWNGTRSEGIALVKILQDNCGGCEVRGSHLEICSLHQWARTDQRGIDGLVFAKRALRETIIRQEFELNKPKSNN